MAMVMFRPSGQRLGPGGGGGVETIRATEKKC